MLITRFGSYERASREDGDKAESDTIVNQRDLISNYVKDRNDMEIVQSYSDDNYSGTNFNRPAFQRMFNDLLSGKINGVIVKDLSRFGRDYIDVGRFLQKEFPKIGVRFIAINDGIDTFKQQYDMIMPIKNIFNEQYARDVSTKILTVFKNNQKSGKFMGAFAGYGFFKSKNDPHKLIIDPYAADIIRRIFDLYKGGKGTISIVNILNKEGVLCPSEYKKSVGFKYTNCNRHENTSYWTYSTMHKLLMNEMYIGNMVQNKYNSSKFHYGPKQNNQEEWIIVPNTHEAIIDKDTWDTVQALMKRNTRVLNCESNVSIFAGFTKCGDCGRAMTKTYCDYKYDGKDVKRRVYYVCGSYLRYKGVCSRHSITADTLKMVVKKDINKVLAKISKLSKLIEEYESTAQARALQKQSQAIDVEKYKSALARILKLKKGIYEDYKLGIITQEEYAQYKADYETQTIELEKIIDATTKNTKTQEELLFEHEFIQKFKDTKSIDELTRATLEAFIDTITIFENKKVVIKYKCQQEVDQLLNNPQLTLKTCKNANLQPISPV